MGIVGSKGNNSGKAALLDNDSKENDSSDDDSEDTFIGKNILNAFKALNEYRNSLKKERDSMKRYTRRMDASTAAKVSKSLRKLYANTKKSLSILDKSVNQSYSLQFPKDKKRPRVTAKDWLSPNDMVKIPETKKVKLTLD